MRYYQYSWDETRDDHSDPWGTSVYLFEVESSGYVIRQIELYANGNILKYSYDHEADAYGMLAAQPFDPVGCEDIEQAAFYQIWNGRRSINYPSDRRLAL